MRCRDMQNSAVGRNPMNFVHRRDQIGAMLDHVVRMDLRELILRKRLRQRVEIVNHVGVHVRHAIQIDSPVQSFAPTPEVQDF